MVAETLIGVGCDPECKWKAGVLGLCASVADEKADVPTHEPYALGDIRPTDEGYATIAQIDVDTQGLFLLRSMADKCGTRACAVETVVDLSIGNSYGSRVTELINDLKG